MLSEFLVNSLINNHLNNPMRQVRILGRVSNLGTERHKEVTGLESGYDIFVHKENLQSWSFQSRQPAGLLCFTSRYWCELKRNIRSLKGTS